MPRRRSVILASVGLLSACGGGGGPSVLIMRPIAPAYVDESSLSPQLATGNYSRIMIVPPSGSAGVEFQESLAAVERSFIARGITVISSAITSRIILGDQERERQRVQQGLALSEVERALLLAKDSNADAVMQIGVWEWVSEDQSELSWRYFVEDKSTKSFNEVDEITYEEAATRDVLRRSYGSYVLGFTGRLIDVENGEIVASFKIDVPRVNTSDPFVASFDGDGNMLSESYSWANDGRTARGATQRAISALFDRLADLLSR